MACRHSTYISFNNYQSTPWDGANSTGIISDNYFDSPYVDVGATSTNTYSIPTDISARWLVERNINQTVTRKLQIYAGRHISDDNIWTLSSGFFVSEIAGNRVYIENSSASYMTYQISFKLTHILPPEVKLVYVKSTVTNSAYTIILMGRLRVHNSINGGAEKIAPDPSAYHTFDISGGTYDFILNESDLINYINSINGYLDLVLKFIFNVGATANVTVFPIEIQYRW